MLAIWRVHGFDGPQMAGLRDGLGLLDGSLIDEEGSPGGYAADSGVGLLFVDGELAEVITAREEATGYRVERGLEEPLAARLL